MFILLLSCFFLFFNVALLFWTSVFLQGGYSKPKYVYKTADEVKVIYYYLFNFKVCKKNNNYYSVRIVIFHYFKLKVPKLKGYM